MSGNGYRGEEPLELDGVKCTIAFDWDAIGAIQTTFGKLVSNVWTLKPDEAAEFLAIGLKKYNPDFTAERIKKLSPPYFDTMQALDRALFFSYFGVTKDEPEKPAADKKPAKKSQKKTT